MNVRGLGDGARVKGERYREQVPVLLITTHYPFLSLWNKLVYCMYVLNHPILCRRCCREGGAGQL